ncbi:MAG TPA: flagellar biosynthesis anti-sigma factor FlgM [Burkholderiales bacterium]|jgi:negative regulator of flagellin synthesis FlgM|nr:flagellar biosynthesis anti-sigma factor FlgM [Burkholderiales bacterium]
MKIENSVKSVTSSAVQQEPGRPGKGAAADAAASPVSTNVKLSSLSAQLHMIEKGFADTPVVDAAHVAELKEAISEGRFKVNSEAVADKLIDTVKELIRAHKGS